MSSYEDRMSEKYGFFSDRKKNTETSSEKNNEISIFPNPSNGVFNIEIPLNNLVINIINVYGQIIPVKILNSKIDLSAHPDGIYFVLIYSSQKNIYSKKLILNKDEF